ncbi:hypothetical protein SDC9_134229 [bioreactor metagenome]|uniref:Uncharacterized protein n=1 Tax=bioreactor metagenome TaxID=1076179 RepID=A0A645DCP4_9ZZZZ
MLVQPPVAQQQFDSPRNPGQRRPQIMSHIIGDHLEFPQQRLGPGVHGVECLHQFADFAVAVGRVGDAVAVVAGRYPVHGQRRPPDAPDKAQRNQPADANARRRHDRQQPEKAEGVLRPQPFQRFRAPPDPQRPAVRQGKINAVKFRLGRFRSRLDRDVIRGIGRIRIAGFRRLFGPFVEHVRGQERRTVGVEDSEIAVFLPAGVKLLHEITAQPGHMIGDVDLSGINQTPVLDPHFVKSAAPGGEGRIVDSAGLGVIRQVMQHRPIDIADFNARKSPFEHAPVRRRIFRTGKNFAETVESRPQNVDDFDFRGDQPGAGIVRPVQHAGNQIDHQTENNGAGNEKKQCVAQRHPGLESDAPVIALIPEHSRCRVPYG